MINKLIYNGLKPIKGYTKGVEYEVSAGMEGTVTLVNNHGGSNTFDLDIIIECFNVPSKNSVEFNKFMQEEYGEKAVDKVNHPSHYTWLKDLCGIEVIDITRHLDFDIGNAVKYLLRAGHKSEMGYSDKEKTIQDLEKAAWYINDKIKQLKK